MVVPAQVFALGPLVAGLLALLPGVFGFLAGQMVGDPSPSVDRGPDLTCGVVAYLLSFAVILALVGVKCSQEPQKTTCRAFADRVGYDEGFFNRHRRTVAFDQTTDVELTEGVLQQTRGPGR